MRGEQNIRRTSLLAIVQTVKFDDLECRPSDSPIWIADRQIRRFGMPNVKFDNLECRPSNSTIEGADCETAQGYPGECIPKVLLNVEHQVF